MNMRAFIGLRRNTLFRVQYFKFSVWIVECLVELARVYNVCAIMCIQLFVARLFLCLLKNRGNFANFF